MSKEVVPPLWCVCVYCLCMCVDACQGAGEHIFMCKCVWRPAVDVENPLPHYSFRWGISIKPSAHWASLASQLALGSLLHCLRSQLQVNCQVYPAFMWVLRIQTLVLLFDW